MRRAAVVLAAVGLLLCGTVHARAATWTPPPPTYQLNDASAGNVLSILPPGEHGLVNAADLLQFEANGTRPSGSQDQLAPYANLLYNAQGLTDSQLSTYFNDESFGIAPGGITRTETPSATVNVVIYRDQHEVPHIYGDNQPDLAFGAGYAAAEDRLFEMDVLRHYGAGNLSEFLGPSCADEQMDHDSLLLGGYTTAQKQAQIDNIPVQYGALGTLLVSMVNSYIAGINAYIAATTNPLLLPADYAAAVAPPQPWAATDVIDIATLVGGIFGKGGGNEVANARMLQYLRAQLGNSAASIFTDLKEQNDGNAPTTASSPFPYGIQGVVDPATTALPDDAAAPLTGGPTNTTANCSLTAPSLPALQVIAALLESPHAMSNALLVDAAHSADGHPIAVMGPQVGYYTPQILMEEDLHATDGSYDVEGASFPGTNFLVELGRGRDFAWSATSAETDNVDQRLELICVPGGGTAPANGTSYMFNGQCTPMQHQTFSEIAFTKPGGQGAPVVINHEIYYTVHGVVQGWTTANNGQPVAVVNQRSTYNHEVDSGIGFMRWGMPSQTHDSQSWMQGAAAIQYTFNWFYVDSGSIAYYESGLLPIRPSNVDPNLPSWGTGVAEWQGFLDFSSHVHQVGSPTGYMTSWNNRGAPQFSAADDKFSWGPAQRVQSLDQEIAAQLASHGGKITRAQLVTAMETAAAVDLDGRQILPLMFASLGSSPEPPGVQAMLSVLQQWLADGSLRRKASAGASQYADAAGVTIMDQLARNLERAIFDPILAAGGLFQVDGADAGYSAVPMQFADWPHGNGTHHGSSYQDGYEGYVVKVLRQLLGQPVATPFSADTTSRVCGASGLASCSAAIDSALATTYAQLVSANGGSNTVSSWTNDVASHNAGQTMPDYDNIHLVAVGIVGQPTIDWQNRPTFQQVVEFPAGLSANVPELPAGSLATFGAVALLSGSLWLRRRRWSGGSLLRTCRP